MTGDSDSGFAEDEIPDEVVSDGVPDQQKRTTRPLLQRRKSSCSTTLPSIISTKSAPACFPRRKNSTGRAGQSGEFLRQKMIQATGWGRASTSPALPRPGHSSARPDRGRQPRAHSCDREVRSGTRSFLDLCYLVDSSEHRAGDHEPVACHPSAGSTMWSEINLILRAMRHLDWPMARKSALNTSPT